MVSTDSIGPMLVLIPFPGDDIKERQRRTQLYMEAQRLAEKLNVPKTITRLEEALRAMPTNEERSNKLADALDVFMLANGFPSLFDLYGEIERLKQVIRDTPSTENP